jgi:hypothetical protein
MGPVIGLELRKNKNLINIDLKSAQPREVCLLFFAQVIVFIIFKNFVNFLIMFGRLHLSDKDVLPQLDPLKDKLSYFLKVV